MLFVTHGCKVFEDLRDQVKMGLVEMEANGRIVVSLQLEKWSNEHRRAISRRDASHTRDDGYVLQGKSRSFKEQQEVLEQPLKLKAVVGNPVMMANGVEMQSLIY